MSTPVSSTSIIWEGDTIPELNINKGDKLNSLVAAMVEKLLAVLPEGLEFSQIDFSAIVSNPNEVPESLTDVIQLLVSKVVSSTTVQASSSNLDLNKVVSTLYLNVPAAYQNTNDLGDKISSMSLGDFVKRLSNDITVLSSAISTLTTANSSLNTRVNKLTSDFAALNPATKDDLNVVYKGNIRNIQSAMVLVEEDIKVTGARFGSDAEIQALLNSQPAGLGASAMLSQNMTFDAHPNWVSNPVSVADSLKNLWMVQADAYRYAIGDANPVLITTNDLQIQLNTSLSINQSQLNFDFIGSSIPTGFNAICGGTTPQIQVTDSITTETFTAGLDFIAAFSATQQIDLTGSALVPNTNLTITANFCITNGSNDFAKTATSALDVSCLAPPVVSLILSEPAADQIEVTWVSPAGYPRLGAYTVVLQLKDANNVPVGGEVLLSSALNSHIFTGQVGFALTRKVEVYLRYDCGADSSKTAKYITVNGCISANATVSVDNQSIAIADLNDDESFIMVNNTLVNGINTGAVVASADDCSGTMYIQMGIQPYSVSGAFLRGVLHINGTPTVAVIESNTESRSITYNYLATDGATPTLSLVVTDESV